MINLQSFESGLSLSGRERFKQVPVRLFLASVIAWGLHIIEQDHLILIWLACAAMVQAYEIWALIPFRRSGTVKPYQTLLGLLATTLMAATYGVMAMHLWLSGNPLLATLGALTLSGGLLTNIASGIASRSVFFIGGTPYLLALVSMPIILLIQGQVYDAVMMACVVILGTGSIMTVYQRVYSMRQTVVMALQDSQDRLDQVQHAMAERAAMAAIISHELRTPVSAISAGAEVIRGMSTSDRQRETADLIVDASGLMTGMLNDLLDHSKMEAGAMALENRSFELGQFIREAARFWEAAVTAKGMCLKVEGAGANPIWMVGDPYRLRQIINNLMSNAVKFSDEGVICLSAEAMHSGTGYHLSMSVRDHGMGISSEAIDRLFTPFTQASAEVARTYGGSGLGLTVSRDLARLMGGDLTAESVMGDGAKFTLTVELAEGQAAVAQSAVDETAALLPPRMKILAVDDHEVNRRTIALVLQPLQVDLTTASSGQMALKLLEDQIFDVVLMDVNMPGLDGHETTRCVRAGNTMNRAIPIIGFSAGTEAAQVQACYAAGMTDWLAKPLELRKLYEALQRALPVSRDTLSEAEEDQGVAA